MAAIPLTACGALQEADQAYHDLLRGAAVRSITDENGENMSFTQADKNLLLQHIRVLQSQCTDYIAVALGPNPFRPPMRFTF